MPANDWTLVSEFNNGARRQVNLAILLERLGISPRLGPAETWEVQSILNTLKERFPDCTKITAYYQGNALLSA